MTDTNIKILKKETYLKMIENAEGSRLFNSLFVRYKDSDKIVDVFNDGELSCASFVSSVLFLFGWIDVQHATTKTTREALVKYGWVIVSPVDIQAGDVISWEEMKFENDEKHGHLGFALNKDEVVSTSYKLHCVARHHITFGTNNDGTPKRKIDAVYRHKDFL